MKAGWYWDAAATGFPKPTCVVQAVDEAMRRCGNPGRGGHAPARAAAEILWDARNTAAAFLGIDDPTRIVFTAGCTASLNTVIHGLPAGRAVVSDHEHNAVMRPLRAAGWQITAVDTGNTDEQALDGFERALQTGADLVICTHASNVTGRAFPVADIAQLCRRRGVPFCLDAAQSAGTLPLPKADFLCIPGHKGFYGPMGTGILAVGEGMAPLPLMQGGTGVLSRLAGMPEDYPERLEAGTPNVAGIAGLAAGIDLVRRLTPDAIHRRETAALLPVRRALLSHPDVTVYEGGRPQDAAVLSFSVKDRAASSVAALLESAGIAVRSGLHCAPAAHDAIHSPEDGTVRLSPNLWATPPDGEKIAKLLLQNL